MHVTAVSALIVAIAGVAVGAIGLGIAWWAWIKVRRVREAQRMLLGGGRRDLVDFAVSLQGRIDDLHRAVDEVAAALARVDRRVDGTVMNTSIVRYDAYEDTGGPQIARPKAKGGGPSPWAVIGGALAIGYALAKVLDWRGHAHPRR